MQRRVFRSSIETMTAAAAFLAATLERDVRIDECNLPVGVCETDRSTRSSYDDLDAQGPGLAPATPEINRAPAQRQKSPTPKESA